MLRKRRSPMVHDFSKIPSANIPRSTFNLSQAYKTTFDSSVLIPFFCQEYVPGDTHSVTFNGLVRLATPLKPIMDNIHVETFFFAVPNRLTWKSWKKFMGEQDNPGDSVDFQVPTMQVTWAEGTTGDYLGLPINVPVRHSVLPFRAINQCYRDWFRSQDLIDSPFITVEDSDGGEGAAAYPLFKRGKRHDYFTSCLPWPQFGPSIDLPLGSAAPVFADSAGAQPVGVENGQGGAPAGLNSSGAGNAVFVDSNITPVRNLNADLTNATAATINDLRQAFQIQKLQERDARGGHRYQEIVLSHFGVRGGDARLNRPEYLGGSSSGVGITQIPKTGDSTTGDPQGNLAAYGTSIHKSGFTKSFTEHGYIIGFINARADLTYQRGLDRHWSRSTKYDFYWPALAKIGEQAVLNKEIYYQNSAADDEVFGYNERWSEMRHNNSKITGLFRSNASASLDVWHLSQDFSALPALNESFINDDAPIDRVIAVPAEPHFLLDGFFQHKATRPMPVNGAPGYIDHF